MIGWEDISKLPNMNTSERNDLIKRTLRGRYDRENEKRLHKLLNERQIRYIPSKNDLEFRKSISSGAFGIVDLVRYQKKLYAHKRPRTNHVELHTNLLDEAIKMTEITEDHPNIQRVCFIDLDSLGFLMEYCDCGTLDAFIRNDTSAYTLGDALNWAHQLADALSFLHSINIMHRDVKIANILLKDNYQKLILTDYGTATYLGREWLTNDVGTPITMAPEIIRGNTYAEQCDIYSWSIVFWQLLAKKLSPYDIQKMTRYALVMKVSAEKLRPPPLKNCPPILAALMYRSRHSDPNERPSFSCIKTTLRILLKFLPKNESTCSTEVMDEVKIQCTDDSNTLGRYFPCQPRQHNERSKNLYNEHSKKLKGISEMKQNISALDDRFQTLYEQNQNKRERYQQLLIENQRIHGEIRALNASKDAQ